MQGMVTYGVEYICSTFGCCAEELVMLYETNVGGYIKVILNDLSKIHTQQGIHGCVWEH